MPIPQWIYINFNDLSEECQEDIKDLARERLLETYEEGEAEDLGTTKDVLIEEKIGHQLQEWNNEGKFIFNI